MKMIYDADYAYASTMKFNERPLWMKDERIDYCESAADSRKVSFFKKLFHNA